MKKLIKLFIVFCGLLPLFSCSSNNIKEIKDVSFDRNLEFSGLNLHISYSDLTQNGFEYGDSISVYFTNGTKIEDFPVSMNYCSHVRQPILCFYPTYTYPHLTNNSDTDLFSDLNLSLSDKATIALKEKGKYKSEHEAMALTYSNKREDFDSDEEFANFRCISSSKIKDNLLYRGASPLFNANNRASTVNSLLEKNNVQYIVDLSNTNEQFETYYNAESTATYWKSLYETNSVVSCKVGPAFYSIEYHSQMKKMVEFILSHDGRTYIHCNEGKDRTGFVYMLLEALCGYTFLEIEQDYMTTFKNFYHVTKENNPNSYNAFVNVKLCDMTNFLTNSALNKDVDKDALQSKAKEYLIKCGLSDIQVENLKTKLMK